MHIYDLFGRGVAAERKRQRLTQEGLARELRRYGLTSWRTGSVGQLEAGLRRPRLDEVVLICAALDCALSTLLPDLAAMVDLGGGSRLSPRAIRATLDGSASTDEDIDGYDFPGELPGTAVAAAFEEHERLAELLRPVRERHGSALTHGDVRAAFTDPADAERHAAARLGVEPAQVKIEARRLWGRDFTAERDARIGQPAAIEQMDSRTLQARRGLVTRELLAELRAALDEDYAAEPPASGNS